MLSVEFWVLLAFGGAVGLTARPLGRILLSALDARRTHIVQTFEEAERLKEEAHLFLSHQIQRREAIRQEIEALEAQLAHDLAALERKAAAEREKFLAERELLLEQRKAVLDREIRRADMRAVLHHAERLTAHLIRTEREKSHQEAWVQRGIQALKQYLD